MWTLSNRTSYAAERCWTRDKHGVQHYLVAVRATFEIGEASELALGDRQTPPLLAPEFEDDPSSSSMVYDADLSAPKPATDVIVRASAYAPLGRAVPRVLVSMRVGPVSKQLVVWGEREYGRNGVDMTEPVPFTRKAIRYEEAFGGRDLTTGEPPGRAWDERNPIGRGFALDPSRRSGQRAPAIARAHTADAQVEPAGLGPIPSHWSPRRQLAGSYDDAWRERVKPLLPHDYDERFSLCAPEDQQVAGFLHGGEQVELSGMSPDPRPLSFTLPSLDLTFTSHFAEGRERHVGRLVTVAIEPDQRRVVLVVQSALRVAARRVEQLEETIIEQRGP